MWGLYLVSIIGDQQNFDTLRRSLNYVFRKRECPFFCRIYHHDLKHASERAGDAGKWGKYARAIRVALSLTKDSSSAYEFDDAIWALHIMFAYNAIGAFIMDRAFIFDLVPFRRELVFLAVSDFE